VMDIDEAHLPPFATFSLVMLWQCDIHDSLMESNSV
jgi:hypothetical protein